MLSCYNKSCGKDYDPNNNPPDACLMHPGVPVFHDALKGWSCCDKKSTDFSVFLNFPGCTKSRHSNEKPVSEDQKAKTKEENAKVDEMLKKKSEETRAALDKLKMPERMERPSGAEPLVEMRRTVAASLKTQLDKMKLKKKEQEEAEEAEKEKKTAEENNNGIKKTGAGDQNVPVGTPCKNNSCTFRYEDETSLDRVCNYHPGHPVFHEGMKYWSCCERKTSDFDAFMSQVGCTEGVCLWFKEKEKKEGGQGEEVDCRFDFHQTGPNVVLTFYSKMCLPEQCTIKGNQVKLEVALTFESGAKTFKKSVELFSPIVFGESVCNFFGTKCEIKLKKAEPVSWTSLELSAK